MSRRLPKQTLRLLDGVFLIASNGAALSFFLRVCLLAWKSTHSYVCFICSTLIITINFQPSPPTTETIANLEAAVQILKSDPSSLLNFTSQNFQHKELIKNLPYVFENKLFPSKNKYR